MSRSLSFVIGNVMSCPEVISSQVPLQTEIIYVLCLIKIKFQSFPLDADILLILLIIER